MDATEQTAQLDSLKQGLASIEGNCTSSEQSQSKYQKCIENLYLNFNQVDGISQNSGSTQTSLDSSFIELSEKIVDVLNQFALPNENTITYSGQNIILKSQKITSKYLQNYIGIASLESDIETDREIYDASIKTYKINPYASDPSFIDYQANVTKVLNSTKMATVFPVINPSIKMSSNSSLLPTKNGNILNFQNQESSKKLTCFTKSSTKSWISNGCLTKINTETQEIQCLCSKLSPTTIVEDISSLFTNNENINTAFSSEGITNLSNFKDFYRYVAFWVLFSQTGGLIILIIKGRNLDSMSFKLHQNKDTNLNEAKKSISFSKVYPEGKSKSLVEKEKAEIPAALAFMNAQIAEKQLSQDKIEIYKKQNDDNETNKIKTVLKIQQQDGEDLHSQKNSLKLLSIEDSPPSENQPQLFIPNSQIEVINNGLSKRRKQRKSKQTTNNYFLKNNNILLNRYKGINDNPQQEENKEKREISQAKDITHNHKQKINKVKTVLFFLHFHDFFSIFLVFLKNLSRQIRFILFYLRYTHTLTISIMFSNLTDSFIQTIFVSILSSVVISVFSKIITILLLKSGFLRKLGSFFTMVVITFYLYLILSVQSGKPYYESNLFIWSYVTFLAMDILVSQTIMAIILGGIAKKVLSAKEDSHNNLISRLFDTLKLHVIIKSMI